MTHWFNGSIKKPLTPALSPEYRGEGEQWAHRDAAPVATMKGLHPRRHGGAGEVSFQSGFRAGELVETLLDGVGAAHPS